MLYFAYGSNMNEDELIEESVNILERRRVILRNYKIAVTRNSKKHNGGVLDIIPRDGEIVEGVLYDVPDNDKSKIDKKEGVCDGAYEPITVSIEDYEGQVINDVISYQVCDKIDAKPASKEYKDSVLRGACEHGLSDDYKEKLKNILEKKS